MYCNNCGAKVHDGQKFCDNCGATVRKAKPADYKDVMKKASSTSEPRPYQQLLQHWIEEV